MAPAKHVPIPNRASITGARLTTSTNSIRSTYEVPVAGYPARPIRLDLIVSCLVPDGAHKRAVQAVVRRGA
jgi:hypothetical protein